MTRSLSALARDALTSFDPSLERRFSGGDSLSAVARDALDYVYRDSLADLVDRVRGGIREQVGDNYLVNFTVPEQMGAHWRNAAEQQAVKTYKGRFIKVLSAELVDNRTIGRALSVTGEYV